MAINFTGLYSENFDTLALSGTSDVLPLGWALSETGNNANTTYTAGTGSSNGGNTYSFGADGSIERALGSLASGSLVSTFGAAFVNSTGNTITNLTLTYTGEQWRSSTSTQNVLNFSYQVGATDLVSGTWIDVDSLDYVGAAPVSSNGALDGNANTTLISSVISGLTIAPGQTFWIRWADTNDAGNDAGLAIDNLTLSASVAPPPAGPVVTIAATDAAAAESGTTVNPGTFTVTRTGDTTAALTVNYTIGGTATNTNDYSTLSGSVVIPAGETSAAIALTPVNDATVEGNETVILTLQDGASYDLGATSSATVTIADNTSGTLKKVGGFTSTFGAEIPAFDAGSDRLFVVAGTTVEVYSVSNTGALALVGSLTPGFTAPGGSEVLPNSVAVKNGVVAVAYAIRNATTNAQGLGQVAFFNAADGSFLNAVEVGYLPDMLTFTPDGTKVLTANEGEPNSYGQANSFDPEGSVSIIDLSGGVANATVQTADFTAFNSQIDNLRAAGVRIFGPGATVAQDLEPEYIAISGDGTQAFVTLQENNALAIVDIATATVTDIKPLGLKDHNQPTVTGLETYTFTDLPVLGTTLAGQDIPLGGFSGLTFDGYAANGNLKFITHTDRGPNGEASGINRPFLLPNFAPEIVRFELSRTTGQITITQRIQLQAAPGDLLSGLPNTSLSSNASQPYNDEVPVDLQGNVLPLDPLGADLEGIVVAPDGTFWMVDEYRPAIYHFDANGVLIDRFVPIGTAAAAGQPAGTFGTEALPAVLAQRRQNRGFEAVAFQDGKVYAFVQSPIRNPETLSNGVLNASRNIRIVEFDPATGTTRQFLYIMDNPAPVSSTDTRADKIGDAVAIGNGEFLVVERDDDAIDSDPLSQIQKKIYRFSLANATDISTLPNVINGTTVDQMTLTQLQAAGITPIGKTLHVDLATAGYNTVEKVEGLTIIDRNTLAVLNDNDFTVAGITIDPTTGTFTPDPNAEQPVLGLINLQNNGMDPSDRDGRINIRNVPVFGMYQPDAIASYTVNGQTYYITANEGDARDYTGFAEEIRVGANGYVLDPTVFPNAALLKNNANLGRLQLTNATGDLDGDGDFDQIQALGSRSFSIWDANGNLVFDSGDQLEQITATQVPSLFNSDGNFASPNFDSRSDNKGPEPEGVVVGVVNNRTYAFIGLERTGDVIVYDVTNPTNPEFIEYINAPEDVGPEGLTFIPAADSPTGKPLLVVTSEVSRTVSVFEFTPPIRIYDIQGSGHTSPLVGQRVTTKGIVTAVDSNGFYFQDARGDGDIATSDGIFVFTGSRPTVAVGDELQVTGTVSEFIPGGASTGNLSTTQLGSNPQITVLSRGNVLPSAVVLGVDRTPPTQVIDNDQATPYNVLQGGGTYNPTTDGLDFYESLEGMRVTINDARAVSGTNRFGEIFTVANNGAGATGLSDRGTINIAPDDFNPERIQVQFDSGILPGFSQSVNVGAQLGDVTGVVGYNFGNFEVNVTEAFTPVAPSTLTPEVTELTTADDKLTVVSYNVLNLDPNDGDGDTDVADGRFVTIAQQIVNNLKSPDIIGLQEIQDGSGSANDGTVSAAATLQALVDAIAAAGGPTYQFVDNTFIDNNASGGQPGGNIRTAFLYNPNRVSLDGVQSIGSQAPGEAFFETRLPLIASFEFNDQEVIVVNNHFSSKGGSSPLFGATQPSAALQEDPSVNGSLDQRRAQAQVVKDYVDSILAQNADANITVLGDLNEFEFISPLNILEQSLTNLTETLPENERYTFIFDGNSQSLDHILVSSNLTSDTAFDIVHVNTEFAETSQRASDHDPLIAQFLFEAGLALYGSNRPDVLEGKSGNDLIEGFNGDDTLFGNRGNDSLDGGNGADILYGGAGGDRISGGRGDDILVGGSGNDTLSGGSGSDRFVYNAFTEGTDIITDFNPNNDILDLTAVFDNLGVATVTDDILRFTRSGNRTVVQIDPDGALGGASFRTLVTLNGVNPNRLDLGSNVLV